MVKSLIIGLIQWIGGSNEDPNKNFLLSEKVNFSVMSVVEAYSYTYPVGKLTSPKLTSKALHQTEIHSTPLRVLPEGRVRTRSLEPS